MQMYFHHVGQQGSAADFPRTVFAEVALDRIEAHLAPDDVLRASLRERFSKGSCNVWGVPSGAQSVIQGLTTGDAVLLVESAAGEGSVPALCPNVIYRNEANHSLSQELWGNARFPYVFFFEAELIDMSWREMCLDLEYKMGWQPRYFVRITPDRLVPYGGPAGYLRRVRELHGRVTSPFSAPSDMELDQLDGGTSVDIDLVTNELQAMSELAVQTPQLTQGLEPQAQIAHMHPRTAAFRLAILRLYDSTCTFCGSDLRAPSGIPEVQAAHIFPKALDGSDDPRNGVCLCARHHWAFDVGWMSIADDLTMLVRDDLPDGETYSFIRCAEGKAVNLPADPSLRPHPLFMDAHRRLHHFELGSTG